MRRNVTDDLVPNPVGRPPHVPTERTRAIAESGSAFGVPQASIAAQIGIEEDALRRHYRKELDDGLFEVSMKVGKTIVDMATEGQDENAKLRAACFYASRRMGWKETSTQEQVGKDGGSIKHEHAISDEDRVAALGAFLAKTGGVKRDK